MERSDSFCTHYIVSLAELLLANPLLPKKLLRN
nr:MAG TPA_asm: hypothetical protein [Caudoviricetes sp.]